MAFQIESTRGNSCTEGRETSVAGHRNFFRAWRQWGQAPQSVLVILGGFKGLDSEWHALPAKWDAADVEVDKVGPQTEQPRLQVLKA